jgi:hypothetical protein
MQRPKADLRSNTEAPKVEEAFVPSDVPRHNMFKAHAAANVN